MHKSLCHSKNTITAPECTKILNGACSLENKCCLNVEPCTNITIVFVRNMLKEKFRRLFDYVR